MSESWKEEPLEPWREDILKQSAAIVQAQEEEQEEAAGPKATRPKNWRLKRDRRAKTTRLSRAKNRAKKRKKKRRKR